jgi:hypothetical protein
MSYDDIVNDLPPVPVEDDNRHKLRPADHCREAAAFMFQLPEQDIAGFIYPWVDNKGLAGGAVYVFGDGVHTPIKERSDKVPVPEGMDFKNWHAGGLSMRLGEAHKRVDLSFKGDRVSIDCCYEAFHPPYAFSSHKDGCPPYYADDRTEQHGRATGVIVIDGLSRPMNSFMQRDHSWGTRIWGLNQHYKWFHATTDISAVHFFEMHSFGKVLVRGFVLKDGRMSEIRSIDYDYTFDDKMHHTSFDLLVTDAANRRTEVKSKVYAQFEYDADPMILLKEGATTVEIDTVTGTGWCEFCWNRNYFEFAKTHLQHFR